MESSSEDSFAWAETSSDKSESPTNSPKTIAKNEESDYDKSFKRKLQKELFQNGDHNEHEAEEPRAKKKKKVKREPDSPPPVKHETNGHDAAAAERLLKLKVKQEEGSSTHKRPRSASRSRSASPSHEPPRKKHKRDRAQRSPEPDTVDAEEPPKKKKKKSKRTSESADILIDKFEAEETVVEERRPAHKPVVKPYTSQEFVDDSNSEDERPAPASPPKQIKERITFEEDLNEPPESDSEAKAASRTRRLTRYLRARPQLRAVGGAPSTSLTAADDVWLIHAPRGLSAQALAGAALSPDARCKLKADGRYYEALPEPAPACAALLLRDEAWRLRGVTLRGALRLRERVPRTRAPTISPDDETDTVPLPVTRIRHPLLGADYELALLPPAPRRSPEPVPVTPKKKKKKKDKSRRSPAPGAGVWDSERGIEESLFNY